MPGLEGASGSSTPSTRPARLDSERNTVPVDGFGTAFRDTSLPPLNLTPNVSPSLGPRSGLPVEPVPAPTLPLIPQPLPTSSLLYILTTSEGRDKMFKLLQYTLKLCISVLVTKDLFPPDAQRFTDYWSGRLQRNISTIRKGRSMFKLGRWVVTLMHINVIVQRLRDQSRKFKIEDEKQKGVDAQKAAMDEFREREQLQSSPNSRPGPRSVVFNLPEGEQSPTCPSDTAEGAAPRNCHKSSHDFPRLGMWLLLVRNVASVVRNVLRDVLFLSETELLGFSAGGKGHSINGPFGMLRVRNGFQVQSIANIMWFVVSCSDLFFNSMRLFDGDWIKDATIAENKIYCPCNLRPRTRHSPATVDPSFIRKKATIFFPNLDMDFGSVTPTTAKFFEAAPPKSMQQCCSMCGKLLRTLPSSTEADKSDEGVMTVPLILRRSYGLVWCVLNHSNFLHTILLQLRYTADVFLSYKFAFGDYEILVGQEGRINTNNRLYLGSIAGLISSAVALLRVSNAAGS